MGLVLYITEDYRIDSNLHIQDTGIFLNNAFTYILPFNLV